MPTTWREIVKLVYKIPPIVLCVLIIALSGLLALIMLYPTAGTTLTSFLVSLCLLFKQVERYQKK